MYINYYYDQTDDTHLANDPEGNLVALCMECAEIHAPDVSFASRGDEESICALCDCAQADGDAEAGDEDDSTLDFIRATSW